MSRHIGMDLAPSAIRWHVRDDVLGTGETCEPIFGIKGCPRHPDYDSATIWSDPFAFRQGEFVEKFGTGTERTVRYEGQGAGACDWLRSFFQGAGRHPPVDVNGTLAVAVPDHASPEERDNVLAGIASAKYANVSLVWRPVAALLAWMEGQRGVAGFNPADLLGRRIFVLDLDAGRPELTELSCACHRTRRDWIIPSRPRANPATVSGNGEFEQACYQAVLSGLKEWEQLVEGQFYGELQRALDDGASDFDAWIRRQGAWEPQQVHFAETLPKDILRSLNPIIAGMWHSIGEDDILLVNGWIVRRYGEQILAPFRTRCRHVSALAADSVANGAALFAERLAKGLPTFYDRIADYQFWDGFRTAWVPMFDGEVEVEPGQEYRYPGTDEEPRKLKIEKFSDNVSFIVRESSSPEYARKIKTDFAEFLRLELEVGLSAVVSPEKGSARFVLTMCDDHIKPIFVSGKTTTREIVLRWSGELNAGTAVSVRFIDEHQGYVEPQPVLGRIYDSDDNLKMVEEYVRNPNGQEFRRLWRAYSERFHPKEANGIADRVGYRAHPSEPTRGLFGTKLIFSSRADAAIHAYAQMMSREFPYDYRDGMLRQNYCHSSAIDAYKEFIRNQLRAGGEPQRNFNFYNAPGYVLGEKPGDIDLLLNYICTKTNLTVERGKLWWSFFRMLCWHPECQLTKRQKLLLERALTILCSLDADKVVHGDRGTFNDVKYLPLAILYALRLRECGEDLSDEVTRQLVAILSPGGLLAGVPFPQTMIPKVDPRSRPAGDNLSQYVLRFVKREDTLADRELGASMGGV